MKTEEVVEADTTGNFSSQLAILGPKTKVTAWFRMTVGATPTVTVKLQGSYDNSNWFDVVFIDSTDTAATPTKQTSKAFTTASNHVIHKAHGDGFPLYRLDFSANTNVTIKQAFISSD